MTGLLGGMKESVGRPKEWLSGLDWVIKWSSTERSK